MSTAVPTLNEAAETLKKNDIDAEILWLGKNQCRIV